MAQMLMAVTPRINGWQKTGLWGMGVDPAPGFSEMDAVYMPDDWEKRDCASCKSVHEMELIILVFVCMFNDTKPVTGIIGIIESQPFDVLLVLMENTMNIVSTTDPISFKDLHGHTEGLPCHVDGQGDEYLTVHFESEANRQEYLAIPTEPSTLDFSNDTEEGVDEG